MNRDHIQKILEDVKQGKTGVEEALESLKDLPYQDLGFARIDHHRTLRRGFPEVIFCQGKTTEQVREIFRAVSTRGNLIMATRATEDYYDAVKTVCSDAVYYKMARIITAGEHFKPVSDKIILIVSAGTSDLPVAEEAAVTAEIMGNRVERLYDVGVAGVHRLFDRMHMLKEANVLVVAAGMEGALASIIGGLVSRPVIAVPTSVGYGASFHGLASLLSMLNACSPGIAVVNIDNGFGAGYMANLINKTGVNQ
ncbi:MAG: nickel pincer cofactor biosynthesis protein LarB [Firmicutes bacterium]|nr:nickel pincer cofactor biosynthesis protein LarB [Bacillota bacterium]